MFGKKVDGTIVGDNLFYYIMVATHKAGLVVDGSVRDLDGISEIDMPAYFRAVDPTPIGNVMLTGINVPIRIGGTTVMPGDLVVGDREGVYFIPPQFVIALMRYTFTTSGPKRNSRKGSTSLRKSTARLPIPSSSRNIKTIFRSASKNFASSAVRKVKVNSHG
jgi:regulator of RNase E activity RraA